MMHFALKSSTLQLSKQPKVKTCDTAADVELVEKYVKACFAKKTFLTSESIFNVQVIWFAVVSQECIHGHQHPRSTKPTLHPMTINKGLLKL